MLKSRLTKISTSNKRDNSHRDDKVASYKLCLPKTPSADLYALLGPVKRNDIFNDMNRRAVDLLASTTHWSSVRTAIFKSVDYSKVHLEKKRSSISGSVMETLLSAGQFLGGKLVRIRRTAWSEESFEELCERALETSIASSMSVSRLVVRKLVPGIDRQISQTLWLWLRRFYLYSIQALWEGTGWA